MQKLDQEIRVWELRPSSDDGLLKVIVAMKRRRNELVPAGALPFDLLSWIFLVATSSYPWNLKQLHQFASVSTYWFDVVVNTPLLWSTVDVRFHIKANEMILRRNPAGHLSVMCAHHKPHSKDVTAFVNLAAKHVHRWKHFHYIQPHLCDALWEWLPEARQLEYFIFHISGETLEDSPPLHCEAPIRYLKVMSVPSRVYHSTSFSHIESLSLIRSRPLPALAVLFEMLTSAPQLRELVIWGPELPTLAQTLYVSQVEIETEALKPVVLPALELLDLRDIPAALEAAILAHIHAPKCRLLLASIALPSDVLLSASFAELLEGPLRAGQNPISFSYSARGSLLRLGTRIQMPEQLNYPPSANFSAPTPEVQLVDRRSFIEIRLTNREHWPHFLDVLRAVADKPIRLTFHRPLHVRHFPIPPVTRFDILREVTQVVSIEAIGIDEATSVIKGIARPHRDSNGQMKWPCPKLEEVKLLQLEMYNVEKFSKLIVACVEARLGQGSEVTDMPMPLKQLVAPLDIINELDSIAKLGGVKLVESKQTSVEAWTGATLGDRSPGYLP